MSKIGCNVRYQISKKLSFCGFHPKKETVFDAGFVPSYMSSAQDSAGGAGSKTEILPPFFKTRDPPLSVTWSNVTNG